MDVMHVERTTVRKFVTHCYRYAIGGISALFVPGWGLEGVWWCVYRYYLLIMERPASTAGRENTTGNTDELADTGLEGKGRETGRELVPRTGRELT